MNIRGYNGFHTYSSHLKAHSHTEQLLQYIIELFSKKFSLSSIFPLEESRIVFFFTFTRLASSLQTEC